MKPSSPGLMNTSPEKNISMSVYPGKIYMTQEQIARAIGSAREAVSRTLKGLVKGGCVELFRGGVRVVDRKELYKKI